MTNRSRQGGEDHLGPEDDYQAFNVMESRLEKLQLLNYEEVLAKHNTYLTRHYFVSSPYLPSNPSEQFYMFTILAAWLINTAGRPFTGPQECDEPNATVSRILRELRAFGIAVDFPPSKLKSGSGKHVCFVLDRLAEKALRNKRLSYQRPIYSTETTEEESVMEDDAELTLTKVEEETMEEHNDDDDEEEEEVENSTLRTTHNEAEPPSKPHGILESTVDAKEWKLELERVLPQLRLSVTTDNKDWRNHVNQRHQHRDGITLLQAKSLLVKLVENIDKDMEKVSSREKYINNQLDHLIQEYWSAYTKHSEARKRYQEAKRQVAERTRVLAEINEELERVKMEIEEKSKRMADGAPVVKMKQTLMGMKQEIVQMDVRIAVAQHSLLQARLKEMSNMVHDMHATNIPTF